MGSGEKSLLPFSLYNILVRLAADEPDALAWPDVEFFSRRAEIFPLLTTLILKAGNYGPASHYLVTKAGRRVWFPRNALWLQPETVLLEEISLWRRQKLLLLKAERLLLEAKRVRCKVKRLLLKVMRVFLQPEGLFLEPE